MYNITLTFSTASQYPCFRRAREAIGQHPYIAGALATIGIIGAGAAIYSHSTQNANAVLPPAQLDVTILANATTLMNFYNALPFDNKPQIRGNSPIEQAVEIKSWMEGAGNETIVNCRELDLCNKGLTALPPEIGQFRALTQLNLFDNQLAALPPEIGQLQALTTLNLSYNQLAALPPEIGQLQALTPLYLSYNQLAALPPEIGQLHALTQLNLSSNELAALPPEIGQLHALTQLNLSNSRLAALPPEIGQLQALTTLNLSYNQLAALPPGIGQLHALTGLSLFDNQLAALPPEIGQLLALRHLLLSNNQLDALPDSILNLSRNCSIDAESNPFNPIAHGQFQQRLLVHRANHPGQGPDVRVSIRDDINIAPDQTRTLAAQLQSWSRKFETAFPNQPHVTTDLTPLLSLGDDHPENLRIYLTELRAIKDYRDPVPDHRTITPKNNVIKRVENMIQLACINPIFKEKMLSLIAQGRTDCDDRKLLIFNDIEIEYQFHIKEMSDREFIPLAQGASIYHLLKEHAIKSAEKNNLRDVVEVILGYHIGVQKRANFHLPITTREMGYPGASGVTIAMLEEAEALISKYTPTQQLERSEHWQKRMSERYPEEAALLENKFGKLFSAAKKFDKYCSSPEERTLWVNEWLIKHPEHPELRGILLDQNIKNFNQAVDAIKELRGIALAHLGNDLVRFFSPRSVERKT